MGNTEQKTEQWNLINNFDLVLHRWFQCRSAPSGCMASLFFLFVSFHQSKLKTKVGLCTCVKDTHPIWGFGLQPFLKYILLNFGKSCFIISLFGFLCCLLTFICFLHPMLNIILFSPNIIWYYMPSEVGWYCMALVLCGVVLWYCMSP